jgi:hypothetical protein
MTNSIQDPDPKAPKKNVTRLEVKQCYPYHIAEYMMVFDMTFHLDDSTSVNCLVYINTSTITKDTFVKQFTNSVNHTFRFPCIHYIISDELILDFFSKNINNLFMNYFKQLDELNKQVVDLTNRLRG